MDKSILKSTMDMYTLTKKVTPILMHPKEHWILYISLKEPQNFVRKYLLTAELLTLYIKNDNKISKFPLR